MLYLFDIFLYDIDSVRPSVVKATKAELFSVSRWVQMQLFVKENVPGTSRTPNESVLLKSARSGRRVCGAR